jgi:hypothetical protein
MKNRPDRIAYTLGVLRKDEKNKYLGCLSVYTRGGQLDEIQEPRVGETIGKGRVLIK